MQSSLPMMSAKLSQIPSVPRFRSVYLILYLQSPVEVDVLCLGLIRPETLVRRLGHLAT